MEKKTTIFLPTKIIFRKLAVEKAADRFEEIDQDNNDQVTWIEYLLDVYAMDDESYKKEVIAFDSYDEEQKMIRKDKEMFKVADLNKDGMLNFKEFELFQNPEEHQQMLPTVMKHAMRDKDTNRDGRIDFSEFVGETADQLDEERLNLEKERFDKEYDLNGNGVLAGIEVLRWIVPLNDVVATNEVDHLFMSTDEDHNNRLSYFEILNNYETFVGSEATDYGYYLQNINHLADEL